MSVGAYISPCGTYRYRLWRVWNVNLGLVCFVMLNPSTADEEADDPTIRRCIRFAKDWGFGGIEVVNLYAYRATDPAALSLAADPVGPSNDVEIVTAATGARLVVAAWGATRLKAGLDGTGVARTALRIDQVVRLLTRNGIVHALGVTATGAPRHPLYVPASARPVLWCSKTTPGGE